MAKKTATNQLRAVPTGTFLTYPVLRAELPPLVSKQRRLEQQVAELKVAEEDEKACRASIDALLVQAGVELVTCNGYDVKHNERAGRQSLNDQTLIELLVAGGVDRAFIEQSLQAATERGAPSAFATVKPSKGAKVRK